jgi:cystathionine beta-lyase
MKQDTTIVTTGRSPEDHYGAVNVPVYRASTILHPTVAEMEASHASGNFQNRYGRVGTPTTEAFETAIAAIEGGYNTVSMSSGLAALTSSLLAFLSTGDHVLVTDSIYGPVRRFANDHLTRLGIEVEYYDPLIGGDIASQIKSNTKIVFVESPGSLTFEVQDIPAIAAAAHDAGALVFMDNTWASPVYCKPFDLGVDISIHACTKYITGHSDAMLGCATAATEELYIALKTFCVHQGICAGTEELFLGLRGMRTLSVRLERHMKTGIELASWLDQRPEVARVLHPALPSDPGHALWQRDFSGASGLFGFILNDVPKKAVDAMLDSLTLYGMGASWGGFESLILPTKPGPIRTASEWKPEGPSLRIHAGLEDIDDLKADLEKGFEVLKANA